MILLILHEVHFLPKLQNMVYKLFKVKQIQTYILGLHVFICLGLLILQRQIQNVCSNL